MTFVLAVTNGYLVGLPILLVGIFLGLWAFRHAEKQDKAVAQTAIDLLQVLKDKNIALTEELRRCRAACALLQKAKREPE